MTETFFAAVAEGNVRAITALVANGQDLNVLSEFGNTPLQHAISSTEDPVQRRLIVELLLNLGCKPIPAPYGGGPLFSAITQVDHDVLAMLLQHGADPTKEHDMGEPLFDWAEFDYRYETWNLELPETSAETDRTSDSAWVAFLDRLAVKYGKPRPIGLGLLLQYGATGHRGK